MSFYQKYKIRLVGIETETVNKHRLGQKQYMQKHGRQMNIQFRALRYGDTTQTQSPDIY